MNEKLLTEQKISEIDFFLLNNRIDPDKLYLDLISLLQNSQIDTKFAIILCDLLLSYLDKKHLAIDDKETLHYLAYDNNIDVFNYFFNEEIYFDECKLLISCSAKGAHKIVLFLLSNYQFSQSDLDYCLSLSVFSDAGDDAVKVVELLIKHGADVNLEGENTYDYLFFDCIDILPKAAAFFLTSRFDASIIDDFDWNELEDEGVNISEIDFVFVEIKKSNIHFYFDDLFSFCDEKGYLNIKEILSK